VEHRKNHYIASLWIIYIAVFIATAIDPLHPAYWLLENILTGGLLFLIWITRRRINFSRTSMTLIIIYLCLHAIGAHFTYSKVPYRELLTSWTDISMDHAFLQRNHFDRLVHLCYGLLLAYPLREVLLKTTKLRGPFSYLLPIEIAMSTSMFYELIEWGAASALGGELGSAYLGTQGDEWDAQKDMALATLGAAAAMAITLTFDRWATQSSRDARLEKRNAMQISGATQS
jgi:putative membrane protein